MKKILVALDASPLASHVLEAAVANARAFGGGLALLRVVSVPASHSEAELLMPLHGVTHPLLSIADEDLERLSASVPADVPVTREVRVGVPWRVICEAADEGDVDLIVIGAHRHKLLDRVFGTTTGHVVTQSDRPTLVVRPRLRAGRGGATAYRHPG